MPHYANLAPLEIGKGGGADSGRNGRCDFVCREIRPQKAVGLREPAADITTDAHAAWDMLRERADLNERRPRCNWSERGREIVFHVVYHTPRKYTRQCAVCLAKESPILLCLPVWPCYDSVMGRCIQALSGCRRDCNMDARAAGALEC